MKLKMNISKKRWLNIASALVLVAPAMSAMAGTTFTGHYYIESVNSGKVLDVDGWSQNNGGNVTQWSYAGGANQQWELQSAGNGAYFFKNVHSGKYLDLTSSSQNNGANIQQWTHNGSNAQKFNVVELGQGVYRLENMASRKVVDVSGVSKNDGANVHQWSYGGANNQKWRIVPVGAKRSLKGAYQIQSVHSNKALDVAGISKAEGANVHQWSYGGGGNQKWNMVNTGNGYYKIQATHSGQMLDVAMGSTANGANIQQAIDNGNDAQLFAVIDAGNNQFILRNKHSGKVLDVGAWATNNGANIVQWPYANGANQKWSLTQVSSTNTGSGQCNAQPIWSDEFNYTGQPDASKWTHEVHGPGWVNDEMQNYTDRRLENARVENGRLILEARKDWFGGHEISSGRVRTANKGDWLNGYIEVRAKLPKGRGTWPAIWMLPTDWSYGGWPDSGEIDIMENVGYDPYAIHASIHSNGRNHMRGNNFIVHTSDTSVQDEFHTYAIDWNQDRIDFYMDGERYGTYNNPREGWSTWPFDKRHNLILNVAIGGMWGGAQGVDMNIFPARMEVDYVRVYKSGACY